MIDKIIANNKSESEGLTNYIEKAKNSGIKFLLEDKELFNEAFASLQETHDIISAHLQESKEEFKLTNDMSFKKTYSEYTELVTKQKELLEKLKLKETLIDEEIIVFKALVSISAALQYICFINRYRIDIESIKNIVLYDLPNWDDVFETLCSLNIGTTQFLIANTECNNSDKNQLLLSIKEKNISLFNKTVSSYSGEVDILAKFAYRYHILSCFYSEESFENTEDLDINDILDLIKTICIIFGINNKEVEILDKIIAYTKNKFEQKRVADEENNDNTWFIKFNLNMFMLIKQWYFDNKNSLFEQEIKIIDNIINQEQIDILCTKYQIDNSSKPILISNNNISFAELEIFKTKTSSIREEYFDGLEPVFIEAGDDIFKVFVNYIANSGYIDNTDEAKILFTYRLTGRCRPSGRLPKLLWDGGQKLSANELIYIVRYATIHCNSKYKKMEKFFEGPNFPKDSRSGFAQSANISFRKQLNAMYPSIFIIKDRSQEG